MSISTNNNRIARNTVFLFIRMLFVLIINLYTSRVVLQVLGISDYGVFNVVAGFVSMFGFLNATLSASMQRFYNYELGRDGESGARRVYVTGFYIHLVFAIIIAVLLESFGLWYVNHVMVVPADRLRAANILFQASIVSLILLILQIPYLGIVIAKERMDFYALISVIDVVLKLCIALVLKIVDYDKLVFYAFLLAGVSVFDFISYFVYSKSKFKVIQLRGRIDKELLKSLLSFSGWNLTGTFAYMLKGQGLNLLLNFFFGPVINAARGIAFQVSNAVNGFSGNITMAFKPQIVKCYAESNQDRSIRLTFLESRVCFLLVALLIVPLCFEVDLVLGLWLGETSVPDFAPVFTCLTLIDGLIGALNAPCTHLVFASGKLKIFQIGSSIVHLLLIPVSYLFLRIGCNATSVFVLTIIFAIINQIVCVILGDHVVHFGLWNYLKIVILPCLLFIVLLPIIPGILVLSFPDGILRLLIIILVDLIVSILLAYLVLFNKEERQQLSNYPFVKKLLFWRSKDVYFD